MKLTPFILIGFISLLVGPGLQAQETPASVAVIGMGGGAFEAMKACEAQLNVTVTRLMGSDVPDDLSGYDVIIVSFASAETGPLYKSALATARQVNPGQKVFCVGPPQIYGTWVDWVGKDLVSFDAILAQYYGLSEKSMQDMVRYILVTYCGRSGSVDPPGTGEVVKIFHPTYGNLDSIDEFLQRARDEGWDTSQVPRVALGTFRHHCLFHQPKVIKALIETFARHGILAVCLIADDDGFRRRLTDFHPDLVVMTSHTRETAAFWEQLDVPRIHSLWFMNESIEQWQQSVHPGMTKSEMQHLLISAEVRGATECLTGGGTRSGARSGEPILPIPDRIERIVTRSKAWIDLRHKSNEDKKIAIVIYDHEADKASLMLGAHHALNAPRSLVKFLKRMREAGYQVDPVPEDDKELIDWAIAYGRQMGNWEPGLLDQLARSGKTALVPEADYLRWFGEKVPPAEQDAVIREWGPAPGKIMVWTSDEGKRFLVLPTLDLDHVTLVTQPPKGETITASMQKNDLNETLLPPTHHFLATYFWMQETLQPDALVHFGSHGSEWLFPGKQAVLSKHDWTDMMIGDLPNVNPWLSSNTVEVIPCKRRARAVTVDFMPPPLMYADLTDELQNLDSLIDKFVTLDEGALKKKFAASITEQVKDCKLKREVNLDTHDNDVLTDASIADVSQYLHDLKNEMIPACMHVLGEAPPRELLWPYWVRCLGKRYLKAVRPLFTVPEGQDPEDYVKVQTETLLQLMIEQDFSPVEAVRAVGAEVPESGLPEPVLEGLDMVLGMNEGVKQSDLEISRVLDALDARFIPPGPSGTPERNPAVIPTGRNLFVLNPEELPTRESWELATQLLKQYLDEQLKSQGHYPAKVAFSLVPFATYNDFGITESQILYLMGVRPVWDLKNRVADLELIPREELGRPRIDVFLSVRPIYREELPGLMKLLDKAVRLVASVDEPDNRVYQNSRHTREILLEQGMMPQRAQVLSQARMFGAKPEDIVDGHDWFFFLTERTGEWDDRQDLLDVYLRYCKNVYTEGQWGVPAPEAFDATIQGTETILRSWYDNRDFVLANKFAWWADGTLSLAIKHLTGKEPDYLFVDVRDPEKANIIDSARVVQRDFRARLTNPKWIRQMMKEGYGGASQISRNANNLMGWEIMREKTVENSNWQDLTDVYVRDREQLGIRQWFDESNPHAFQDLTVTLLETIRKGYWPADEQTVQEITQAYAESVAQYGPNSGLREGGNEELEQFVQDTLGAPGTAKAKSLLEQYRQRLHESKDVASASETVQGQKMEEVQETPEAPSAEPKTGLSLGLQGLIVAVVLVIFVLGFVFRKEWTGAGD